MNIVTLKSGFCYLLEASGASFIFVDVDEIDSGYLVQPTIYSIS